MREQVGRHERAVAVARDGHAMGIGDAAAHEFIDGGLGARDELLDVGVVGFFLAEADDRHRGIIEHRVAGEHEGQRGRGAHACVALGRGFHLLRRVGAEKFARVGPQQRGQRTLLGLVAGRQVERARERDAVGAFVADDFLPHGGELRARIGKLRERRERAGGEGAHVIISRLRRRLAARERVRERGIGERDEFLVGGRGGAPQPARLLRREIEFVHERPVAVGRCAEAGEINFSAVGAPLNHESAEGVARHHGAARVLVAVLRRTLREQLAFAVGTAGSDAPRALCARALPGFGDERERVVAPRDREHAEFKTVLHDRLALIRWREREPAVAPRGL